MDESGEVYHIGGHKVMFPFKPYPTQFDMMSKILRGLDKRQNCLLESPTGSGKTLALLCAALAWQQTEYAKLNAEINEEKKFIPCESCQKNSPENNIKQNNKDKQNQTNNDSCCVQEIPDTNILSETPAVLLPNNIRVDEDDDDKDFVDFSKNKKSKSRHNKQKKTKGHLSHISIAYEMPDQGPQPHSSTMASNATFNGSPMKKEPASTSDNKECTCDSKYKAGTNRPPRKRVPTIFFGSRTHKQLKQVIKELKHSNYKNTRMSVLASRDHTCINRKVKEMNVPITEACKNFLDTDFCRFNHNVKNFTHQSHLQSYGLPGVWDIEDLVKVCRHKKVSACPYFLARSLITQSDIVFCPYNYFIDPIIRQNVGIELAKNIIIIDEAHNIEGSCRDATSFSISRTSFMKLTEEINKLISLKQNLHEYNTLLNLATEFIFFINNYSNQLDQKDFNQSCKIWSGFDIVAQLASMNFGPKDYPHVLDLFKKLCSDIEMRKEKKRSGGSVPCLSSAGFSLIEQLLIIGGFFYSEDLKHVEDFRMAVVKNTTTSFEPGKKKSSKNAKPLIPFQELTLHLWCMNPGIGFGDFHAAHCVILASGTLSPMISFQSELQMPFQISMEGRHVISPSQVWVGSLGSGPSGKQLKATYKFSETYVFQDELASVVLDVCMKVPNGVLCFLSSYTFLDKLSQRWQATGVWEKILKRKVIITEPRSGKKELFEKIWKKFLQCADGEFSLEDGTQNNADTLKMNNNDDDSKEVKEEEEEKEEEEDLRDGALFLAVCRGKLSEGTDFANNSARAVITVGIPYPYVNDVQIGLKKEYNEIHKNKRNLLSGSEWFEIQAYRALNQALGRCIRHKNDWGAIILVDDRFLHGEKYVKGLSKWVRGLLKPQYNYFAAMKSLEHFAKTKSNGHNLTEVSEDSVLETTISKNNLEQSVLNTTMMNVNTLTNLCLSSPGRSTTSQPQAFMTSTPLEKNNSSGINKRENSTHLFLPVAIDATSPAKVKTLEHLPENETKFNEDECSTIFPMNSESSRVICDETPKSCLKKWKNESRAEKNVDFQQKKMDWLNVKKPNDTSEELDDKKLNKTELDDKKLNKTELDDKKLNKTELDDKKLNKTELDDKKLNKTELDDKKLNKTELDDKKLNKTELDDKKLNKTELDDKKLNKTELDDKKLKKTELDDKKLNKTELDDKKLNKTELDDKKLNKTELDDKKLNKTELDDKKLNKTELDDKKLKKTELDDKKLKKTELDDKKLNKTELDDKKLNKTELDDKKLNKTELDDKKLNKTELELTNSQLVDETLKSETLSPKKNFLFNPDSKCEGVSSSAQADLNDKPQHSECQHKTDSQGSPGLFSNSDSDILSIDESYLDQLSRTVIKNDPSEKQNPDCSSDDNDLLSYIENEADYYSSKAEHSVPTVTDTLDDDAELLSFVESEAENLSAFTAAKTKSPDAKLAEGDMNDEDLLSCVEKEENLKKETTNILKPKQLVSRRPLFKTSTDGSDTLPMPSSNLRMAPKKSGCEDLVLNEFLEVNSKEEIDEDCSNLKTKRFMNRKKRQCTGDLNQTRKKVKGVVFEPPEDESSDVICQKCQQKLITVSQIVEKRPQVPAFLTEVFDMNVHPKEMFFFNSFKCFSQGFDQFFIPKNISQNGVMLNSAWFSDLDCCVQYLHCLKCQEKNKIPTEKSPLPPPVVGAKVVMGTKQYTTGQVWLSGSAVKIQNR